MAYPLNENAIRAWQKAKGTLGALGTAPNQESQYSPLFCQIWEIKLT